MGFKITTNAALFDVDIEIKRYKSEHKLGDEHYKKASTAGCFANHNHLA